MNSQNRQEQNTKAKDSKDGAKRFYIDKSQGAMLTGGVEFWDDSDASVFGISNDASHVLPAIDVLLGEGPSP